MTIEEKLVGTVNSLTTGGAIVALQIKNDFKGSPI